MSYIVLPDLNEIKGLSTLFNVTPAGTKGD